MLEHAHIQLRTYAHETQTYLAILCLFYLLQSYRIALHLICFLTFHFVESGDIYGWGWNESGQVGTTHGSELNEHNITSALTKEDIPKLVLTPSLVETPLDKTFVSIAAGSRHSVALADDGAVYGWGWNGYGQLDADSVKLAGTIGIDDQYLIPTLLKINNKPTVKDIKCFNWSTLLLF